MDTVGLLNAALKQQEQTNALKETMEYWLERGQKLEAMLKELSEAYKTPFDELDMESLTPGNLEITPCPDIAYDQYDDLTNCHGN